MSNPTQIPLTGITEPTDADVLCARGKGVLQHKGNQTYRQLVNANRALYLSSRDGEKHKISRSVITAVRNRGGRFLEKNPKDQTWYDIGDDEALKKVSQALREKKGQPKPIICTAPQGAPSVNMEVQYSNGVYSAGNKRPSIDPAKAPSVGSMTSQLSNFSLFGPTSSQSPSSFQYPASAESLMTDYNPQFLRTSIQTITSRDMRTSMQSATSPEFENNFSMRSGRSKSPLSGGVGREHGMSDISDFSGLSSALGVSTNSGISAMSWFSSATPRTMTDPHQDILFIPPLATSGNNVHDHRRVASQVKTATQGMSNVYTDSGQGSSARQDVFSETKMTEPGLRDVFTDPGQDVQQMEQSPCPSRNKRYDPRRIFAQTKASKIMPPPTVYARAVTDSTLLPYPQANGSDLSLVSNLSFHGASWQGRDAVGSERTNMSGLGTAAIQNVSTYSVNSNQAHSLRGSLNLGQESVFGDNVGLGSRRSLMSGLSKISDTSTGSTFSDLKRKLDLQPSMSNRSVAVSEMSGIYVVQDD